MDRDEFIRSKLVCERITKERKDTIKGNQITGDFSEPELWVFEYLGSRAPQISDKGGC